MSAKNPKEEEIIYTVFQLMPNHQVRVTSTPYAGQIKIHMREWWRRAEEEEYKVGRGMTIPIAALEEVSKGFFLALELLKGLDQNEGI